MKYIVMLVFAVLLLTACEKQTYTETTITIVGESSEEKVEEKKIVEVEEEEENYTVVIDLRDGGPGDGENNPPTETKQEIKQEDNQQDAPTYVPETNELENGYAFWVYGSYNEAEYFNYVDIINDFNSKANSDEKIRYLFVWAGEYTDKLLYKQERVDYFKDKFPSMEVLSMIDGSSRDLEGVDLDSLADDIASEINSHSSSDGIHMDIEVHNSDTEELTRKIKSKTSKLVTEAISGHWDKEYLDDVDFTVLMNYAHCDTNVKNFEDSARGNFRRYYRDCVDVDAMCMHGILVTPTTCEKDQIIEHVHASMNAHDVIMSEFSSSNLVGISMFRLNYAKGMPSEEVLDVVIQ